MKASKGSLSVCRRPPTAESAQGREDYDRVHGGRGEKGGRQRETRKQVERTPRHSRTRDHVLFRRNHSIILRNNDINDGNSCKLSQPIEQIATHATPLPPRPYQALHLITDTQTTPQSDKTYSCSDPTAQSPHHQYAPCSPPPGSTSRTCRWPRSSPT